MKKLVIVGVAVGLVMAGGLIALLGPWPCRVTRANCHRIKEGMTQAEVHAILGGPPGEYRTQPPRHALSGGDVVRALSCSPKSGRGTKALPRSNTPSPLPGTTPW